MEGRKRIFLHDFGATLYLLGGKIKLGPTILLTPKYILGKKKD